MARKAAMAGDQPLEDAHRLWAHVEDLLRRRELEVTQLMERVGLSRSMFYRWRSGQVVPKIEHLMAVERELGLERGHLLRMAGKPVPAPGDVDSVSVAVLSAGELTEQEKRVLLELYELFLRGRGERGRAS